MWKGKYSFFDYKYNIDGYSGQDFDGIMRWVYLIFSIVVITALLIVLRKAKRKHIDIYLKIMAVVMPLLEITKVTWESVWDVTTGRGLNVGGLLPLYTCSLFIYCSILAGFTKGKVKDCCLAWMSTIGIVGGVSNLIFIQGLKWYPFFTFGAFYSMLFHFIMVFNGLFIVVTGYKDVKWKDILKAYIPHLLFSLIVIPIDLIFKWDYMQYYEAGGVPFLEGVSDKLAEHGVRFLTVIIMLVIYLLLDALFISVYVGIKKVKQKLTVNKEINGNTVKE